MGQLPWSPPYYVSRYYYCPNTHPSASLCSGDGLSLVHETLTVFSALVHCQQKNCPHGHHFVIVLSTRAHVINFPLIWFEENVSLQMKWGWFFWKILEHFNLVYFTNLPSCWETCIQLWSFNFYLFLVTSTLFLLFNTCVVSVSYMFITHLRPFAGRVQD